MANNIDDMLRDLGAETPKISPYLGNKIYSKAKEKEYNKNIPFFKKPLIITFSSVLTVLILLVVILSPKIGFNSNNKSENPSGNDIINQSQFVPNLSPNTQSTVFIDYNYTVYSDNFDIVTLIINNRINYQRIYLKAYNLNIDDLKVNNGDITINQVTFENQLFFEIIFNNKNTTIHYIDLCFKKGTIDQLVNAQKDYELEFIMYIDEVNHEKGYGYNFKIKNIFDFRNGTNL